MNPPNRAITRGFTLTELAIVLVIIALLTGGLLVSLSTTRDIANEKETQKQLGSINEALLGYAAAQQRLPCPAAPGTTGVESPVGGGACTNNYDGFVPGITLGITPTNSQGYAIDAWGNPIRYAVTSANSNAFTTAGTGGIRDAWTTGLSPDLQVCNTATGISGGGSSASCAAATDLSSTAVAVIFSNGKNGASAPTAADELANWTTSTDRVFVSTTPGPTFDDLVVWLSPNVLYNRMIAAGRLP